MFNYEFVEDFQDEQQEKYDIVLNISTLIWWSSCIIIYVCHSDVERRPSRRGKFDEKLTYGCGYMDVRQSKTENFTTTWGPVGFTKENHSLWIMVSDIYYVLLMYSSG